MTNSEKNIEDLKETKGIIVSLKIHLEESKRTKESLKGLIVEKEDSCHKLELEVVDLKK